ncbi:MAG: ATP-binding protein [Prevotella sp.]|nr:ATP-binding protein [Prevotella sp.]
MEIKRDYHLQRLVSREHNGMVKVVTGMRRSGKSYLLFTIFYKHLLEEGVADDHIVRIDLEDRLNKALRNPDELLTYVRSRIKDENMYYILLDEVQHVNEFEDVLNSMLHIGNADVYVTGSNAKFLSKDVITEFRGRGDEVNIRPLGFKEFLSARPSLGKEDALREYMTYGGLPQTVTMQTVEQKENYLKSLFTNTYLLDIKERYNIKNDDDLEELISMLASGIGGLVNAKKLQDTFHSVKKSAISYETIKRYLDMLQDAFILERAVRYDIKGRRYISTTSKYYFEDLGLRNARINFRQSERTHLLENMIYNELRLRGFSVDVGEVSVNGKNSEGKSYRSTLEVDFVCNSGYKRHYIQSALALPSQEKMEQELNSLRRINDDFQKILIVGDAMQPTYQNEDGILILNVYDFLLDSQPY